LADDRLYKMTIEQFILLGDPILKVGGYPGIRNHINDIEFGCHMEE
jgi:hypothetical protein